MHCSGCQWLHVRLILALSPTQYYHHRHNHRCEVDDHDDVDEEGDDEHDL